VIGAYAVFAFDLELHCLHNTSQVAALVDPGFILNAILCQQMFGSASEYIGTHVAPTNVEPMTCCIWADAPPSPAQPSPPQPSPSQACPALPTQKPFTHYSCSKARSHYQQLMNNCVNMLAMHKVLNGQHTRLGLSHKVTVQAGYATLHVVML